MTAFTTAGVAPIVPASPTPLTPSGLTGVGVSVLSISSMGIVAAGNRVVHQRSRDELAVLVVDRVLAQRLAETLRDAAVHLAVDAASG